MHPIIITTPWFNVYSYGFLLAIGYTVAIVLTCYKANKNSLDAGAIFDLMLLQLIVGVLGSRFLFLAEFAPDKLFTLSFLALEQGGLTFYGSVITGFFFDLVYLKFKQIPIWKAMDCLGFGMAPGIAVSRIGCFLNGCCYGLECSPSIGFQFRAAGQGYYHATQLYESLFSLVIFIILLWFIKYKQTHHGQIALGFLSLYGFFRFFIEFLRAENPVFLLGMTLSQLLSIIFIITSIIIWKINNKNKELEIMPNTNEVSLENVK